MLVLRLEVTLFPACRPLIAMKTSHSRSNDLGSSNTTVEHDDIEALMVKRMPALSHLKPNGFKLLCILICLSASSSYASII